MEFDNKFFKQWKTKTKNNRLFAENSDIPKSILMEGDQIFSSTVLEDQTETETFSLRLSEPSYIDETQESLEIKLKQKHSNEVIIINDSSSDESMFSNTDQHKLTNSKNVNLPIQKDIYIRKPFNNESSKILNQFTSKFNSIDFFGKERISVPKPCGIKQLQKYKSITSTMQDSEKEIIIEESDSEIEESKVPQIIKETVVESATLSERKKREILHWLETNFDGPRCGSSCSQESAIPNSRNSGLSSGNSSLERLELNFETPNNRGKLSKPNTAEKSNKKVQKESEQHILDQYFKKSKKGILNCIKVNTPGSNSSDKTSIDNTKTIQRKIIIPESESLDSKDSENKIYDNTPVFNTKVNKKKVTESQSSDSKKSENRNFDNLIANKLEVNSRKIIIQESESLDSQRSDSGNCNKIQTNNLRKIIIPESESFETNDIIDTSEKYNEINCKDKIPSSKSLSQKISAIIPETVSLEITDDIESLNNSVDLKIKDNQEKCEVSIINSTINTTINDCADILENLYGVTWRNKAKTLVSATEPKKHTTKKFFKDIQTERKINPRKKIFNSQSDNSSSATENECNVPTKSIQTTTKKSKNNKHQDSFINDDLSESSPDCSYYTALTNPSSSQNNLKTTSTIKASEKNKNAMLLICDSESDLENDNWKTRNHNQRKLSFDSSTSSNTSEFDPDDIVPPKTAANNMKIKNVVDLKSDDFKTVPKKQIAKNSFLASLSKDVPLENADFKAMIYRVKYNTMKEDLCKILYKMFNEKVFDNKLPNDMSIEWSARLRGTAGKCYNKQSLKALGKTVRSSRLVLATKILDSPDRLRDTLIHEMCHAATWLINNISDGHGSFWKAWANKATKVFPELPPISRCHNYEIKTKYTYKCTSCGYNIGRHSKSLDLNRKRCGYCHGTFELLINKVTKDGKIQKKSTSQTKEPSRFALYVKENYNTVKQSNTAMKHGDVMKMLGQQFSAVKLTPKAENRLKNNIDKSP